MPIEGKIAKILDEFNIIVNKGRADGVAEGMRFVVYAEVDEVTDPETGESLGNWELIKGRLAASHVQDKMTVCSAETRPADVPDGYDPRTHTLSAEMIAVSMMSRGAKADQEKLDIDRSSLSGIPSAKPITVGDRVRSVGQ